MKSNRLVRGPLVRIALALLTIHLCSDARVFAQASGTILPETEEEFERLLEEANTDDPDYGLFDLLERYRDRPIPLYAATVDELAALPGISPQAARRILDFVAAESPESFDRFAELGEVDPALLPILRLYTTLSGDGVTDAGTGFTLKVRTRLVRDLQRRRAYAENLHRLRVRRDPTTGDSLGMDTVVLGTRYAGGQEGILTRLLMEHGPFACGVTFEKDPGERLRYSDTLGFGYENFELVDPARGIEPGIRAGLGAFLSAHMVAELKPATILIGDYTAEFGQGLLFGGSFAGRKGSAPTRDPYRPGNGLQGYRSSAETGYFRGIGVEMHAGVLLPSWLEGSFFASRRSLDASLSAVSTHDGDTVFGIGSINTSGYLRTPSEIRRDDNLTEELIGLHLTGRLDNGEVGVTAYHGRFDLPFAEAVAENKEDHRWSMASLDATRDFSRGRAFGEVAVTNRGDVAAIAGIALQLRRADVTFSARHYGRTFSSPHGVGFGESPVDPGNEQGFYIGVRTRLFPRTFLSLYGDLYRLPAGSRLNPFGTSGIDGMALFECGVTRELDVTLRATYERRGDDAGTTDDFGRDVRHAIDRTVAGGRLDMAWHPKATPVEARFRLERKTALYSDLIPSAAGVLTYADCRWRILPSLSVGSRLVLFRSESPDVRLYEFEQDVPGRMTSAALSGEGGRFYILARWQATSSLALSVRYAETWYADREVISPGTLQQIDGRTQSQVVAQVDWEM